MTPNAPNNFANNPSAQSGQSGNPNSNKHARSPLVTQSDITKLEERVNQQVDSMERRMLEAMRGAMNSSNSRKNQAKVVRSTDEEASVQGKHLAQQKALSSEQQGPDWRQLGRTDRVKILKIASRKQLSLQECGGHQITKELECESSHCVIHSNIYVEYLKGEDNDVDSRALAKALRGRKAGRGL